MSLVERLNKMQRAEMIEIGMNPLNEAHVQRYLKGNMTVDVNENIERMKAIMGDKLNVNLGHANESVSAGAQAGQEYTPPSNKNTPEDIRKSMMNQMNEYAETTGNVPSSGLNRIRKPAPMRESTGDGYGIGKRLAENYFNAFIDSLQNPSTASHLNTFKALKEMLEKEKGLSGSPSLASYKKGVMEVTIDMYNQLKGNE